MVQGIYTFLTAEDGAITVDWVVLTASLCALALAVTAVLFEGFATQSTELQQTIGRDDLICTNFCDRFPGADEDG